MNREKFKQAKEIIQKIEKLQDLIDRVDKTDSIYYKTPDMDGGYTPGKYVEFYESARNEIKEAMKSHFQNKIDELNKEFERL